MALRCFRSRPILWLRHSGRRTDRICACCFAQAFNSLGTVVAPYLGAVIMLSGGVFAAQEGVVDTAARRAESLRSIDTAFFIIVVMIVLLTVLILAFRKRMEAAAPSLSNAPRTPVL